MINEMIPLNEAEGIFFPAFDKYLCNDEQIQTEGGVKYRLWDSLAFRGGKSFRIHWQGKVCLDSYDSLVFFLSIPKGACVSGSCVVDGRAQELFRDAAGEEAPLELGGRVRKGKNGILTDVFLTVASGVEENILVLSWLGAVCTEKLALAEEAVPAWQPEWNHELIPDVAGVLRKSIVLSQEEGKMLQEQVCADTALKSFFIRNAEEGMEIKPEEVIREYVPVVPHLYRFVRERDRGRAVLEGPILNLAIAGWLLGEARYSYQAAKLILALLPMKWFEGPVCDMKGSQFHHVCFTEEHLLTEVSLAMGFLGGVFREPALRRIVVKLEGVWRFVRRKCLEPGYRNYMNQGLAACRGVMLGAAFLQQESGGYEKPIEECFSHHAEIVRRYLTEDGHCAEGGNYFEYSFTASILLWHVYALYRGCPVQQVIPESFLRSGRYLEAVMSSNDRKGVRIPLNCSGGVPCSPLLLTFMTIFCDFPEGNNYLIARFANGKNETKESSFDFFFYLLYGRQLKLHPCYRAAEEEINYAKEGLLSYRRGNTKLLVTAERNPLTGHFHEDRGGIVLEADGDMLLPELGTTGYADPLCLLMDKKEYHNLACPAGLPMEVESEKGKNAAAEAAYPLKEKLLREEMELPEAKIVYSGKREEKYTFAVETGMLYGRDISGLRTGELEADTLRLTDSWSFPQEETLLVTFLSYEPWAISGERGRASSGRLALKAESESDFAFETEDGMADFERKPVYVLRIRSKAAVSHEIHTALSWKKREVRPENSGRENALALQALLDQGGDIYVEKPGVYEIEDTLIVGSNTRLRFGAGVSIKRSAGSVGSFAFINRGAFTGQWDTDITIEGLHLITDGVEARMNAAVYGLTGELSFFRVRNLKITDFTCMDLPALSFGIHVCTFENLIIERVRIEGRKDAIHLGRGKRFFIRDGLFRTFDDPIALNAHDYAVANPQMGWIEDGLIENCYDLPDDDTTGYFCRILAGAWCDWEAGMPIQNSDTVVSGGRVYRAFQEPDGTFYRSQTPPTHKEGMETIDGINWVMIQEDVTYRCGCRNIHFKDIHLQKQRETALSIHFDHDRYSRSVYPGAVMPVQENLVFENITVEGKVGCLIRSITPVNTVKILNSRLREGGIQLQSLGAGEKYPPTQILLSGNTYQAEGATELVSCEDGRSCSLTVTGSLVEKASYRARLTGKVAVMQADIPIAEDGADLEGKIWM